ncbi:DNA primase [candidate division WWE3 bacterium RIFOXYC1_FULL_39_7]|uniref:DNA primase n=2 Tax=Katanobacteria TaxID=422282 RepID=A0A1F4X9R2_UNCKA|nr:MAG: DNA primase [candidate division WWE3 bacterium RIFOXYC1_FULL_39_7]OGC78416.1 MAG: DNA primase [candidate division WWE3 bacterium RIFOXYD1_FULL_39_9]
MDAVSEIKQKLDIVDVVSKYVSLKKAGKNYKGVCPFHSENTPSFMVSPELQMFKCFGCGESGDMFSFIQKIEGVEFMSALETLAEKAGVKVEKTVLDPDSQLKKQLFYINDLAVKFYHLLLTQHEMGKPGMEYLKKKRGLTDETIKKFMLGYAPDSSIVITPFLIKRGLNKDDLVAAGVSTKKSAYDYIDKFRGRVLFPLIGIDGRTLGFTGRTIFDRDPKYLNTNETLIFKKSSFLYGLDKAKLAIKKEGAVFVEGQMDVISAHQAGIENVIASSGTSLTTEQLKVLSRYTKDITFCFDSDTAGIAAVFRAVELAENMDFNVRAAVIPEGFKDIDEVIRKGVSVAREMLEKSIPAYDFILLSVIKRYNKTSPEGKKKIMDELVPWFSKINNKVLIDHYSKEIAKELDLSTETVISMLAHPDTYQDQSVPDVQDSVFMSKQSLESYIISLLLKADLDTFKEYAYKLKPEDFKNETLKAIFTAILQHRKVSKDFVPGQFSESLEASQKEVFSDLYMWDHSELLNDQPYFVRELSAMINRVRKAGIAREMVYLTEQIKLAEKEKADKQLAKLTKEFEKLKDERALLEKA